MPGNADMGGTVNYKETAAEELARLRRTLSEYHHETPEHRMILDRIAVLVREAAVARRSTR